MSTIIAEIKTYPPADRLRMILMILGTRPTSSDHDELLSIAFDSVRTLERIPSPPSYSSYSSAAKVPSSLSMYTNYENGREGTFGIEDDSDSDSIDGDCLEAYDVTSAYKNTCECVECIQKRNFTEYHKAVLVSPQEIPPTNLSTLLDQIPPVGSPAVGTLSGPIEESPYNFV